MSPFHAPPTPFLVTWLVHSSLCLALCWALERARLVTSVRARECLWRTALLGSLVTAALRTLGLPAFDFAAEPELGLTRFLASATPVASSSTSSSSSSASGIELLWRGLDLASLVWAVGAAFGLLRLVRQGLGTGALARRARPVPAALAERWRALCTGRARVAPRLALAHELSGPVSLPVGGVLVPPWVAQELDPRQQDALLAHELAHVVRRDPLWHLLGRVLGALLWPQPLVRLARRRLEALAELAADQWAVAAGARGRSLAECLLACATRPRGAPSLASGLDGSASLPERVERLLAPPTAASAQAPALLRAAAWLTLALVGTAAPGCDGASLRHGSRTSVTLDSDGLTKVSIERDGERLTLESDTFELRDDLGGVSALAPDARFTLTAHERGERTTYRAQRAGPELRETFTRNGAATPLDTTARAWITSALTRIGSETSFSPQARTTSALR